MKRVIYKYDLASHHTVLNLPTGAEVLRFDVQHGSFPRLWVSVPAEVAETEERTFEAVPTGELYGAEGRVYIGTVLVAGGVEVWHLFEILTESEER